MSLSLSSHGASRTVTKVNKVLAGRLKKDGRRGEGIAALLKNTSQSAFRANVISTTPERNR